MIKYVSMHTCTHVDVVDTSGKPQLAFPQLHWGAQAPAVSKMDSPWLPRKIRGGVKHPKMGMYG